MEEEAEEKALPLMEEEEEEEEGEGEGGEEQVMSEVHLGCPPRFSGRYVSRFTFSIPCVDNMVRRCSDQLKKKSSSIEMHSLDSDGDLVVTRQEKTSPYYHGGYGYHCHLEDSSSQGLSLDEDGDLILARGTSSNERCLNYVLTIQHNITSSLRSVGLQVWRAALVLADFVLHKGCTSSDFDGVTALELGAGTGLVGIVLARVARAIFLTDTGNGILDNCEANVHLNSSLYKVHETSIHVRELDWRESWPPIAATCDFPSQQRSRYAWDSSEIEEAEGASLLLAADVIYSDELTDSFFSILERLMSRGSKKVLYLALEKRYNFTLEDLDVVANGYAHFRSYLKGEQECAKVDSTIQPCFEGKQIDHAQIPQYIREYERGKDVELWRITYSR